MFKAMQKPTPREVESYGLTIQYKIDGEAFCDYYESKGWLIGKSPMVDWKAAVRTWKRRNTAKPANPKCCTGCGGNIGPDGKVRVTMLYKEGLPWCGLVCYERWVRNGRKVR
jgi:hypothetical protein